MSKQFDPQKYSHIVTRLDNNESYTLTSFAKGEFMTVEFEGDAIHKINVGVHEMTNTFHVNRTLTTKVTYQFERLARDNIFFTELVNNSIPFSLSVL